MGPRFLLLPGRGPCAQQHIWGRRGPFAGKARRTSPEQVGGTLSCGTTGRRGDAVARHLVSQCKMFRPRSVSRRPVAGRARQTEAWHEIHAAATSLSWGGHGRRKCRERWEGVDAEQGGVSSVSMRVRVTFHASSTPGWTRGQKDEPCVRWAGGRAGRCTAKVGRG